MLLYYAGVGAESVTESSHRKYLIQGHFIFLAICPFSLALKHRSGFFFSVPEKCVNINLKALLCYMQCIKLLTTKGVVNEEWNPFLFHRNVWFTLNSIIQCIKMKV